MKRVRRQLNVFDRIEEQRSVRTNHPVKQSTDVSTRLSRERERERAHTATCYATLYDISLLSSFIISYHTIPYHTISYHTIPYHTIPTFLQDQISALSNIFPFALLQRSYPEPSLLLHPRLTSLLSPISDCCPESLREISLEGRRQEGEIKRDCRRDRQNIGRDLLMELEKRREVHSSIITINHYQTARGQNKENFEDNCSCKSP